MSFSGLGRGQTVARRMADLIGGTLIINSQPGSGTRVSMKIPSHAVYSFQPVADQRRYG